MGVHRYALPSALDPLHFPPLSESLQDCQGRLLPFLEGELQPAMTAAVERAKAKANATGTEYEVAAANMHVHMGVHMRMRTHMHRCL